MSSYNENFRQTVMNTLTSLSGQQTVLGSQQAMAKYNLYYAQGTELAADEKLDDTRESAGFYDTVDEYGITCDNQAINLLASLVQANTGVTASTTNAATAAANIQIASNAVMKLSSDIGAALNIATASMFGTDTYKRIVEANNFINHVANDAKNVSLDAMDASAETAEIIAAATLAQANLVKAQVENVLAAADAELNKFSTAAIAENQVLGQTERAERKAAGALLDANCQANAIDTAYANANSEINQSLSVKALSQHHLQASFKTLSSPSPVFTQAPACDADVPSTDAKYYLVFVPTDKTAILSTDQAEQMFASKAKDSKQFIAVPLTPAASAAGANPDEETGEGDAPDDGTMTALAAPAAPAGKTAGEIRVDVSVTDLSSSPKKTPAKGPAPVASIPAPIKVTVTATVDVFGNAISPGKEYAACLFIELGMEYKRYVGDFSDRLSAPSLPFIPATQLPKAMKTQTAPTAAQTEKLLASAPAANTIVAVDSLPRDEEVSFWITPLPTNSAPDSTTKIEYRCILVSEKEGQTVRQMQQDKARVTVGDGPDIYFDRAIAEQVAPTNYTVAAVPKSKSANDPGPTDEADGESAAASTASNGTGPAQKATKYVASFGAIATDNFGNPIVHGKIYKPYVLAIAVGTGAKQFVSCLSDALDAFVYK